VAFVFSFCAFTVSRVQWRDRSFFLFPLLFNSHITGDFIFFAGAGCTFRLSSRAELLQNSTSKYVGQLLNHPKVLHIYLFVDFVSDSSCIGLRGLI
jgi:hypothetical protein